MNKKKLLVIFSHKLTKLQKKDISDNLKTSEIIYLPEGLQQKWSNIPPDIDSLNNLIRSFTSYIDENTTEGDYILIQGDFGATFLLVDYCLNNKLIPIYSTTERKNIETANDNIVEIKKIFKHCTFRRYERWVE